MISNPNPNNFYSIEEMLARKQSVKHVKDNLIKDIKSLQNKIKREEAFPEKNISIDDLVEISDVIDGLLSKWNY